MSSLFSRRARLRAPHAAPADEALRLHAAALVQPGPTPTAEPCIDPCTACHRAAAAGIPLDELAHPDCEKAIQARRVPAAPPLPVQVWPAEDIVLVEQMRAVRPGLTTEQAHAALQALRTLGAIVHRGSESCAPPAPDGMCTAETIGVFDTPLRCALGVHTGFWHQDAHGTRWRDSTAGGTRVHGEPAQLPAVPGWAAVCPRCVLTDVIECPGHPGEAATAEEWAAHLHRHFVHPGWEYRTTEGPRKQWDDSDVPPVDAHGVPDPSWLRNVEAGREGWEQWDYSETSYWRRPVQRG